MDALYDHLKSLGVALGTGETKPAPRLRSHPIEEVVDGEYVSTIFGDAFISTQVYTEAYAEGDQHLLDQVPYRAIYEWAHIPEHLQVEREKVLFLDTETTGLAGGTGTFAFLIGIGFFKADSFTVQQFFLRDPIEEAAVLTALQESISPYQVIVTFNGRAFDVPLLNTRFLMNGIQEPFSSFGHVDLLPLARRIWKDRLPSRALSALEVELLGISRTQEEVPGFMIPQIFLDYLHTQDARPLSGVFYHNAIDILSLASLMNYTAWLMEDPVHVHPHAIDLAAIARLYEELGHLEKAVACYEASLQEGLPPQIFAKTIQRFALMYKHQENWDKALALWEKASEYGSIDAAIELAKYYEHHQKENQRALAYTQKALELYSQARVLPPTAETRATLQTRQERLSRKLENGNS